MEVSRIEPATSWLVVRHSDHTTSDAMNSTTTTTTNNNNNNKSNNANWNNYMIYNIIARIFTAINAEK